MKVLVLLTLLLGSIPASAHDWYSGTKDPVSNYSCCGGSDCAAIPADWVTFEPGGLRVKLTLEQSKEVNPGSIAPVNAFVPMARVQMSPDLDVHLCIYNSDRSKPKGGVICMWWSWVS